MIIFSGFEYYLRLKQIIPINKTQNIALFVKMFIKPCLISFCMPLFDIYIN